MPTRITLVRGTFDLRPRGSRIASQGVRRVENPLQLSKVFTRPEITRIFGEHALHVFLETNFDVEERRESLWIQIQVHLNIDEADEYLGRFDEDWWAKIRKPFFGTLEADIEFAPVFNPESFLALAGRMIGQSHDEATLRTVISRAYYSAFLLIRHRLGKERAYRMELWDEVEAIDSMLGGIGHRLRKLRNKADYGDRIPDLEKEAGRCIRRAAVLLARIS